MKSVFQCTQCGDCCKGYGGTFVTEDDIRAIAEYLQIPPDQFIETYCDFSGDRPILAQQKNGYCVFWDELCKIHPVKPRMCKAWPYIESVLIDVTNWHIMAGSCPGMRTDVSDDRIRAETSEKIRQRDRSQGSRKK